jgi:TolB-like protein
LTDQPNNEDDPEQSFLARLIKRHVIQSAAIYVAVAWGALEILITLQEKLGWPPMISTWATRLFVAGFPVAVILAWRRDVERHAIRVVMGAGAFVAAGIALWLTLSTNPVERAATPTVDPVNSAIATVAVLPFENANGDDGFDYLAKGFTGELIGRLSKHPDLAVIQEESLASPSLLDLLPAAQAATLRADYMVQGKVLREGGSIEVTASLQDLDGLVLWSEILREPYSAQGVTAMQRRISGEISRLLGTTLDAQAYCGETSDLEAMELFYRGRQLIGKRNLDDALAGLELVKQAVDKDPYFGRAWNEAGNGNLYASGQYRERQDREQAGLKFRMAISTYRKALDICPTIGMAYKVIVPAYEDAENAIIDQEMQWRDALAMDPNDAAMLRQYFFHLMNSGMLDEGIEVMQRAYEVEPLMAMIPGQYAHALMLAARCDEAIPLAEEAEQLGGHPSASIKLTCSRIAGDADGMLDATLKLAEWGMDNTYEIIGLPGRDIAAALLDPEHPMRPVIADRLHELWNENPEFNKNRSVYWIVGMATTLGEYELVLDMLDGIADPNDGFHGYTVAWSPLFANWDGSSRLRSHPRFVELLNKTGLHAYWRKYGWPNGCEGDGESFRCF